MEDLKIYRWQACEPYDQMIVLYRPNPAEPDGQPMKLFGYSMVKRQGLGQHWWRCGGGSDVPPASSFVDFGSGSSSDGRTSEAILYRQTLAPEVIAVEATFDNGQTLRDRAADGVFAIAAEVAFNNTHMTRGTG